MSNLYRKFRFFFLLSKPIISLTVSLSAITGYILAAEKIDIKTLYLFLGIYAFSGAASTLNQIQERKFDKLMKRTKNRLIPSGKISIMEGLIFFIVFSFLGSVLLLYGTNGIAFILAVSTMIIYNLIYTPLKRVTMISIFIGAIVGALPPLIGWVAGNGYIFDWEILVLAMFFYMGQIPHFSLLSLKFGDEFKTAGYPVMNDYLSINQIKNVSFIWILATGMIALMISLKTQYLFVLVFVGFVYLSVKAYQWLKRDEIKVEVDKLFKNLNLFFLLVMVVLCLHVYL